MSAECLRPKAERALRGASARRIERDERIEQERHVIARDIEIALIDVGHIGQYVEVLNLRTIGIVHHAPVLPVRDPENLVERFALRKLDDRVIELLAADK